MCHNSNRESEGNEIVINMLRVTKYKLLHSMIPIFLVLFGIICGCFALFFRAGRIVDIVKPDGGRIGFFPSGSMDSVNLTTNLLATVQSINFLAWIGVVVVLSIAFHNDVIGGAQKMAVCHGGGRIRYEIANYLGQSLCLQFWYACLNLGVFFILSTLSDELTIGNLLAAISLWGQSALLIQVFLSLGRLVCYISNSEVIFSVFSFLEIVIALIVAASNTQINPSLFTSIMLYATPMPYWLELGACNTNWMSILLFCIPITLLSETVLLLVVSRKEIK